MKELDKPENLARHLLKINSTTTRLYNIDLSKVTIRRSVKKEDDSFEKKIIHLDFNQRINQWDGKSESAKRGDFQLESNDTITLTLKPGKWNDYTPRQKKFIEAALTYKIVFPGDNVVSKNIKYKFPTWIQTSAGLIPVHKIDEIASPRGEEWLTHAHLQVHRGKKSFYVNRYEYWPRDGDQLKKAHRRTRSKSTPAHRAMPGKNAR